MLGTTIFAILILLSAVFGLPTAQQAINADTVHFNASVAVQTATLDTRGLVNAGFVCMPRKQGFSERASCYHEVRTATVFGDFQELTTRISCDTATGCHSSATFTFTNQQSFSISVEANVDSDLDPPGVLKGGASAGINWSWETSVAKGSVDGYDLRDGDAGHVRFWPFMRESCGDLAITSMDCPRNGVCVPQKWEGRKDQVNAINACGYTPLLLKDGTNSSGDGVATFCYTGGPRSGQGCDSPLNQLPV